MVIYILWKDDLVFRKPIEFQMKNLIFKMVE